MAPMPVYGKNLKKSPEPEVFLQTWHLASQTYGTQEGTCKIYFISRSDGLLSRPNELLSHSDKIISHPNDFYISFGQVNKLFGRHNLQMTY